MYLIKKRLEREYGLQAEAFNYPSVAGTLDENAAALVAFMRGMGTDLTHVIGHSLGGIVALRAMATIHDVPKGRLVCLGSPLSGSRAGRILDEFDWAMDIIGNSLPEAVIDHSASEWAANVADERDIGIIAGTVPLGFGQLVARFDEPNDGTVAVSETHFEGARDHLVMKTSHKGMLVSADVADQAGAFLRRGEFLRS